MPGSSIHKEALTKRAAELFPNFSRLKNFYLVGGTALALQIGHRLSVDFDFFSKEELPKNLFQNVKRLFPNSSISITYRSPEQINILLDEIKTTFFYYPYPVVNRLVAYQKVGMASVLEIAAMKAHAIGQRLAYKDYVDWYFILKEGYVGLSDVIKLADQKLGGEFSDRLFLGQLVSLVDIKTQKIDFLRSPVERSTIEQFLEKTVKNFRL